MVSPRGTGGAAKFENDHVASQRGDCALRAAGASRRRSRRMRLRWLPQARRARLQKCRSFASLRMTTMRILPLLVALPLLAQKPPAAISLIREADLKRDLYALAG